jgi:hypothetical protein
VIHEGAVFEGRSAVAEPGRAQEPAPGAVTEAGPREEALPLAS